MSEEQKLEQLSDLTGIDVEVLTLVRDDPSVIERVREIPVRSRVEELRAMRDELKAKQAKARELKQAVKVAKDAYRAESLEHGEMRVLAAMDRADARATKARESLAVYQARTAKLNAAQKKIDRLAAQKRGMNGARQGAVNVQTSAGRALAQDQLARTHGASDEAPRWQPRPEPRYMP